jgi:hypothetical protein
MYGATRPRTVFLPTTALAALIIPTVAAANAGDLERADGQLE